MLFWYIYKQIGRLLLLFFLSVPVALFAYTDSDSTDVQLIVAGCNNNLICEDVIGENVSNCPLDCTITVDPVTTEDTSTSNRSNRRRDTTVTTSTSGNQSDDLSNITVFPGATNVAIAWVSAGQTLGSVQIGKTPELELFRSYEFERRQDHFFYFENLTSETTYYYQVESIAVNGVRNVRQGTFTTNQLKVSADTDSLQSDMIPSPAIGIQTMPQNLKLKFSEGEGVVLSWQNPTQKNFDEVIVVRTLNKKANSPEDGIIVYQGDEMSVIDTGIVDDVTYFYTLFAIYDNGGISDGTTVRFSTSKKTQEPVFFEGGLVLYDFSLQQTVGDLNFIQGVADAAPYQPILITSEKKAMFDPVGDMYLSVESYTKSGLFIETVATKFAFDREKQLYQAIYENNQEDVMLVISLLKDFDGAEKEVIGIVRVGAFSGLQEEFSVEDNQRCWNYGNGLFLVIKNTINCWNMLPIVVLLILLTIIYFYFKKRAL